VNPLRGAYNFILPKKFWGHVREALIKPRSKETPKTSGEISSETLLTLVKVMCSIEAKWRGDAEKLEKAAIDRLSPDNQNGFCLFSGAAKTYKQCAEELNTMMLLALRDFKVWADENLKDEALKR
jgi:hypothetical protein